jgi:hypothetical protein
VLTRDSPFEMRGLTFGEDVDVVAKRQVRAG